MHEMKMINLYIMIDICDDEDGDACVYIYILINNIYIYIICA